ncbi:tetratricopeptide repeat protein [Actinoallomurus sp. NPDC050550]|uniref:tetratricopeptide repeat protein n=1 Tax=Actinoallomurus sp. NPDC050550 TaxID=3154937 RepID=UPI0033CB495E
MEIEGAPPVNSSVSVFRIPPAWWRRAIVGFAGLLSAAVLARDFSRPHALVGTHEFNSYNDGVYFGAALRLTNGYLPYRDFTFLHPPGLPMILAPIAALSHIVGEPVAMAIARLLTAVTAVGVVVLGTLIVRYRGRIAMMTAGVALACSPRIVDAADTVELEGYLLIFCLLGTLALFDSTGRFTSSRHRTLAGGLAFGFACTVKVWALMPIVAVLAVCAVSCLAHKQWWRVRWLLGGITAGAAVPLVPFFAPAPAAFVHDVVVVQLTRRSSGWQELPIGARLQSMTGLDALPRLHAASAIAIGALLALALAVVVSHVMVGDRVALDWFILAGATVAVAGLCVPHQFFRTYGYLPAVFLALLLGVVVGRFARAGLAGRYGPNLNVVALRRTATVILLIVGYVAVLAQIGYTRNFTSKYVDSGRTLSPYIRPGACVVSDGASALIEADRLVAARRCPATVDVYGQWLAANPAHPPPYIGPFEPRLIRTWESAISQADYVLLAGPQSTFVPWTVGLHSYFWSHYALIYIGPGGCLFQKIETLNPKTLPPGSADRLLAAGISAQRAADTADAQIYYTAAARIDPRNALTHFDLGTIFQGNGNAVGAQSEYKRTLAINPRFGGALYNMGVLLAATRPAKAISYYRRDLRVEPGHAAANLNLGLLLVRQGETSRGRTLIRKAIRLNPAFKQQLPPGIKL